MFILFDIPALVVPKLLCLSISIIVVLMGLLLLVTILTFIVSPASSAASCATSFSVGLVVLAGPSASCFDGSGFYLLCPSLSWQYPQVILGIFPAVHLG